MSLPRQLPKPAAGFAESLKGIGLPGRVAYSLYRLYRLYENLEPIAGSNPQQGWVFGGDWTQCPTPNSAPCISYAPTHYGGITNATACINIGACPTNLNLGMNPLPISAFDKVDKNRLIFATHEGSINPARYTVVAQYWRPAASPSTGVPEYADQPGIMFDPLTQPQSFSPVPWEIPINEPFIQPEPLPFWAQPLRNPWGDPNKAPNEQPQRGPLPNHFRPPAPKPYEVVQPSSPGQPGPTIEYGDGMEPPRPGEDNSNLNPLKHPFYDNATKTRQREYFRERPDSRYRTDSRTRFPAPPGRGVKERKAALVIGGTLSKIVSGLTETNDAVKAIWDALPKEYRSKGKLNIQDRLRDLYNHWDKVDLPQAVANLIQEQLQDAFYGKAGQLSKRGVSNAAEHGYYRRSVGLQSGDRYRPQPKVDGTYEVPLPAWNEILPSFDARDVTAALRGEGYY